nr:TPA_inf: conotoxin precursor I2 [Conus judaeus]
MMCRMTSLCCLLVIVFLNSAVDGIPCNLRGDWCFTGRMRCCSSHHVCCSVFGTGMCLRKIECPGPVFNQRRR